MLRVKAVLKPSAIHGLGVFAAQHIKKGTIIWAFDPRKDLRIPKRAFSRLPAARRRQIARYAYTNARGDIIICGDNALFFNHSERPNCSDIPGHPRSPHPEEVTTVARRAIRAGEELTCDYRSFDHGPAARPRRT